MTPQEIVRHPIILAALEAHGTTPDEVIDSPEWRRDDTCHFGLVACDLMPDVHLAMTGMAVHWGMDRYSEAVTSFHLMPVHGEWHHTVIMRRLALPAVALTALAGCALDRVVELPGGGGLTIDHAEAWLGTTLHLRPWEGD